MAYPDPAQKIIPGRSRGAKTRLALGIALAMGVGTQLAAQTTCTFTTECLEGEACSATEFTATITAGDADVLTWATEAETLTGRMIASDDNLHYVFEAATAAHLVTDYPDGAARYSVHMDGPFTITYHGTCDGAP